MQSFFVTYSRIVFCSINYHWLNCTTIEINFVNYVTLTQLIGVSYTNYTGLTSMLRLTRLRGESIDYYGD